MAGLVIPQSHLLSYIYSINRQTLCQILNFSKRPKFLPSIVYLCTEKQFELYLS